MKKYFTIICSTLLLPISTFAYINTGSSIFILNDTEETSGSVIPQPTVKTSADTPFNSGWLRLGYLNNWDGTTALTGTQIKNDWVSVGLTVPGESSQAFAQLGKDGGLGLTTYSFNDTDSAAVFETGEKNDSKFLVLIGNGTDFNSADNTDIALFSYLEADALKTWADLVADASVDFTGADVNGTEWVSQVKYGTLNDNILTLAAIPEPSMFGLLAGLGALALIASRRRRK